MVARSLDYALDEAAERGYTEEHSRSENGHTIFLQKPDAELNRLGFPNDHAEVSWYGDKGWRTSFCGKRN